MKGLGEEEGGLCVKGLGEEEGGLCVKGLGEEEGGRTGDRELSGQAIVIQTEGGWVAGGSV